MLILSSKMDCGYLKMDSKHYLNSTGNIDNKRVQFRFETKGEIDSDKN